ncbi:hypothetical protein [Methylorubrum sp. SL192]|uniref:hypothetical protein n=1 Tax=Methylorubrum sp. SL192 TaxID=2995167 RepID=UPI001477B72F|nr:hypothetical protein [Methylorubrum sp. SL192]MCY1642839.1 hypothetical protein [Methylorubrum sp. SL192]
MTIGSPKFLAGAALAFFLLAGSAALAKKVTVVTGDRPISVEIPAAWKVTTIDRGVQARTADEEIYLWFESYKPTQFDTLLGEHNAYFKEQGVKVTGEGQSKEVDFPTYALKVTEYPATYEGKPTVLRYLSVVPKAESQRHLLVSYWASPEGDKKYDAETNQIMNSLAASYDGK